MGRQKVLRRTLQSGPLGRADRFLRVGVGIVGTRFYLHEDDGVAVRRDQIDLAQGTAVIAVDDAVTATPQIARGDGFPASAEAGAVARRPQPRVRAQQPFYYGREVHEAFEPCRSGHVGSTVSHVVSGRDA